MTKFIIGVLIFLIGLSILGIIDNHRKIVSLEKLVDSNNDIRDSYLIRLRKIEQSINCKDVDFIYDINGQIWIDCKKEYVCTNGAECDAFFGINR